MSELGVGADGASPLRVVREGAAAEELAREALGSLGTAGEETHDTHPCRTSPAPQTQSGIECMVQSHRI
jgi:hypothetical protein